MTAIWRSSIGGASTVCQVSCGGSPFEDLTGIGRTLSAPRGAYSVTGLLPENDGQPEYRIKHFSEDYERVAQESELSPAL